MKTLRITIFIFAIALIACKKEKPVAPTVFFERPFVNASFSFGDTVLVLADVDHPTLKSISTTIVDANFNPVEEVQQIFFSQIPARVHTTIILKNKRLQSGKHYVRIQTKTADGELYNFFQAISVGALNLESEAIYVVSQNQNGTTRWVHKIVGNQIAQLSAENANGCAVAANGFHDNVIIAPSNFGNRLVFAAANDSLLGQEQNTTAFLDTFMKDLYRCEEQVYGLYANGQIVGYSPDGLGVQMSFNLPVNFIPKKMLRMQNTLVIIAKRIGQNGKVLLFYNALTRAFIRQIELSNMNTAIAILPYGQNDFLVLFNDYSNLAKWERYDLSGQYFAMPSLPNWFLVDAVATTTGSFVFATNLGLFNYSKSVSGFIPLTNSFYNHLVFDAVKNQLVVALGTTVSVLKYPEMTILATHNASAGNVVALDILYNK